MTVFEILADDDTQLRPDAATLRWPTRLGEPSEITTDLDWNLTQLGCPDPVARDLVRVAAGAYLRDGDPVILRQVPPRDHLHPRADHGRILQPRAAAAGHGTAKPPSFPGLGKHADDPARLGAPDTPRDQPPELLPFRRQRRPAAPTLHHRNP